MKKLLIAPLLISFLLLSGCWVTTEDGEQVGQVTAVEKSGLIFKTALVFIKTDKESSSEDIYCVEDVEVARKLREFSKAGERVLIQFHDEVIIAPWRCGTSLGVVDEVEKISQ